MEQTFDKRIRDAISAVTEGEWREFATFAGPRLNKITGWDKVALIGDASHPLSGKFICHDLKRINHVQC